MTVMSVPVLHAAPSSHKWVADPMMHRLVHQCSCVVPEVLCIYLHVEDFMNA